MKSEPSTFSIDDLRSSPDGRSSWEGVRNFQARNFMRDEMRLGDHVLFYHSSCDTPGVAGIAEICREAHPDPTALDPASPYYDCRATVENPRWFMVDIRFIERFEPHVSLTSLREIPELAHMRLLQRGQRLSILPVAPHEWDIIIGLARNGTSRPSDGPRK